VDHLDGVHQGGKSLGDGIRVSVVKWVNELLKGLEILHVVLGFVQSLGHAEFNAAPLGGSKVNLVTWLATNVRGALRSLGKNIVDSSAVLASELLGDTSEFSHSLFPVLELLERMRISVVDLLSIGTIKSSLNLAAPLVEDVLEVVDHLLRRTFAGVDVPGFVLPMRVEWSEVDVALERLESLFQLT